MVTQNLTFVPVDFTCFSAHVSLTVNPDQALVVVGAAWGMRVFEPFDDARFGFFARFAESRFDLLRRRFIRLQLFNSCIAQRQGIDAIAERAVVRRRYPSSKSTRERRP